MRVINDREEVKQSPEALGPWAVPLYAFLCAFGMTTFFFSPMTLILAHRRLGDFWPKVTAVLGAVIALTVLEASMPVVMVAFIFGLFVADGVQKEVPFWKLFGQSTLLMSILAVIGLVVLSTSRGIGVSEYWTQAMADAMEMIKLSPLAANWDIEVLKNTLIYEGPFLFLGGAILSFWVSIGLSAHFEWFPKGHVYHAESLREKIQGAPWQSVAFMALFILTIVTRGKLEYLIGGVFRLASVPMFIYGTLTLSRFLEIRKVTRGLRAVVYSILVCVGFYAVVGIGVLSPWAFRRKTRAEVLPVGPLEEAI